MDANEAMSKAMVAGQRWLQYGASSGPTGEVCHLRAVPPAPAGQDAWWAEMADIEEHLAVLEAEVFALACRLRRFIDEVVRRAA